MTSTPPSTNPDARPAASVSREDQARAEIGHTTISRPAAWVMSLVFLAVCGGGGLIQLLAPRLGLIDPQDAALPWQQWQGTGDEMTRAWREAEGGGAGLLAANRAMMGRITAFSDRLDDHFWLAALSRDPVQSLLLRLGQGNEKACLGRDGWLFYLPDVDHLTGAGFLDPRHLRARRRGDDPDLEPDPLVGILDLHRQLAERDITLVLMPVSVKPAIQTRQLTSAAPAAPLHNSSWAQWLATLTEAGIAVYDPAADLAAVAEQTPAYLRTDTHWSPAGLRLASAGLAATVLATSRLDQRPQQVWRRHPTPIAQRGDIAIMLQEGDGEPLLGPESTVIDVVRDADGQPWRPASPAPVLLLGDSFTNIYSLAAMGWGEHAGLAEQLAYHLQSPVDRVARNDAGAIATRRALVEDLAQGRDRLAQVRVLVWQFSARELSFGDWRPLALPTVEPGLEPEPEPDVSAGETIARGRIVEISDPPDPGAPYADYLMLAYVTDLRDPSGLALEPDHGIIRFFAKRQGRILPTARLRQDQTITLRLVPWQSVAADYDGLNAGFLVEHTGRRLARWFADIVP